MPTISVFGTQDKDFPWKEVFLLLQELPNPIRNRSVMFLLAFPNEFGAQVEIICDTTSGFIDGIIIGDAFNRLFDVEVFHFEDPTPRSYYFSSTP